MGWILLLDPKYGLMNQGLIGLGLSQPLFNIYSFWGIVWAHLGGTVSVKVMLLAPAFRNLDAAFEEASKISGASGWRTFFHIVIPVMMPAILVTTILGIDSLLRSLRDRAAARHADRLAGLLDEDPRAGHLGAAAVRAGDGAQHGVSRRAAADGGAPAEAISASAVMRRSAGGALAFAPRRSAAGVIRPLCWFCSSLWR